MAAPPLHLPLLLAFLLLSTAAASSPASHSQSQHLHLQHHGHGSHHHRLPSMMTATARLDTAPSMHQNRRMESESEETRQSLRVLNPFFTPVAAQAPSGEEAMAAMGAAADAGDTTRLDLPSPPPSLVAEGDPMPPSLAPLQPQAEEVRSSESEAAAPPPVVNEPYRAAASPPPPPPVVDEPHRDAASPPPPPPPVFDEPYRDAAAIPPPTPVVDEQYRDAASPPPPPVHDDAAGAVPSSTGGDLGLQQISKVLASLGYNEMASSASLLADTASVAAWPGAITVFAAPDVFLQASCPECSRGHLLLDHMALGYFPYADLAAAPAMKLPSASVGFCLDVAAQTQRGPFSVQHASLYIDGVMVSEPELYNDGRYVVHGLHGFIPPLSHASCVEDAHAHHRHQVHLHHYRRHHHLSARSAATSASTAASVVRIMIREAISRLRDSGFVFVALAMRVKFAELEKLSNLTVFALNDQAIFTSEGHGYASAVRFHIVPEHRLTRADLLRLRPGIILPTLAGEDQKLVVTLGAGSATDEVRINYIPVKEPDVVINSRVAVHGIYIPFPRLHLAASVAVAEKPAPTTTTRPFPKASAARPRHPSGGHFHMTNRLGHGDPTGGRHSSSSSADAAAAGVAGLVGLAVGVNHLRRQRRKQRKEKETRILLRRVQKIRDCRTCILCGAKDIMWRSSECGIRLCSSCVENGFLHRHVLAYASNFYCASSTCCLIPVQAPEMDPIDGDYVLTTKQEHTDYSTKIYVHLTDLQSRKAPKRLVITYKKSDNSIQTWWKAPPAKLSPLRACH